MINNSEFGLIYQSALLNAQEDVARHSTTSRACFSAKNAAKRAFVFLLATMATSLCAPATTTGRTSVEDPNALENWNYKHDFTYNFILLKVEL